MQLKVPLIELNHDFPICVWNLTYFLPDEGFWWDVGVLWNDGIGPAHEIDVRRCQNGFARGWNVVHVTHQFNKRKSHNTIPGCFRLRTQLVAHFFGQNSHKYLDSFLFANVIKIIAQRNGRNKCFFFVLLYLHLTFFSHVINVPLAVSVHTAEHVLQKGGVVQIGYDKIEPEGNARTRLFKEGGVARQVAQGDVGELGEKTLRLWMCLEVSILKKK